ncbi:hypothetical protein COY90_02365 [Candidatus Roizmanbacteria bacterium CG_4_10_14_0_8_um_filter_39_9]|uniref:DUF4190 domain-containing protein n=1 Tax=Candidatus Roizmanbacteria bacterium CG_4_10_14_0_8_um_filter_39_9 TaxID=1974829 RepID=A0A2M7QD16_9BACT|nr:MAG: hypothetical protein COY90_02365 [Candidatus Roizmanbacteria bacterium CG_4_10_14_0_8_um_filter_39_9]
MKKLILLFLFVVFSGTILSSPSYAAITPTVGPPTPTTPAAASLVRYVTCDACGYCPKIAIGDSATCEVDPEAPPPSNWSTCVKCLYPVLYPKDSKPNAADCKTVKIQDADGIPPAVAPGRQHTMLGCITSQGGFSNNQGTGASSFVQALFDLLVFKITGSLAFLYLMYGASIILTSQSDPEKLAYGRRVIMGAVIGLIFTFSSVFIVNIIGSGILKIPGFAGTGPVPTSAVTPTP